MNQKESETLRRIDEYPLMEEFYSIQGEGYHQGKPAYFIRLAGCDVGCHWCDVKESWSPEYPRSRALHLADQVRSTGSHIAVITGGEPLTYDCSLLTREIKKKGIRTHLETSGVYPLTGEWDWICLSPKKFRKPEPEIWSEADELKVIIYHKSDLQWAENQALKVRNSCKLYLQPEWSKQNEMLPLIINYVKENPKWNISLQIHKFMDIP
jgi:organic radical activating enzyme